MNRKKNGRTKCLIIIFISGDLKIPWKFLRLAYTSLKSVEVPPLIPPQKKNAGFFWGSFFFLYFHFFLTKSFRRKYRILQILWRMSEKSMEVIYSIRELNFCFFWKKNGAFFQDYSHFWILKMKFWKNNVTLRT